MFRTIKLLAIFGFGFAALLSSGCASKADSLAEAKERAADNDASFAAGARRPPSASTSYALAKLLAAQGRDRDALYLLARIVREHPSFVLAYNEMADIYVRSDRIPDAVEVLNAALQVRPEDAILLNNLGTCRLLSGDAKAALDCYSKAADLSPANPVYRANRAMALGMLGRDQECEAEYHNVVSTSVARQNLRVLAEARRKWNSEPRQQKEAQGN
jgi:Flp pilus assembly protein TadD